MASREKLVEYTHFLSRVRELDPVMPAQQIQVLLIVALHPGTTIAEIATRTGHQPSSASRCVSALGTRQATREPGLGLVVAEEDPKDRRHKRVRLTPAGERFINTLD
jgi:DNA-binding MarR family transcriptional regulator